MRTIVFEMIFQFCEHIPGASPFAVRREKARDFFEVYVALTKHIKAENRRNNSKKPAAIRKPAGDNWF